MLKKAAEFLFSHWEKVASVLAFLATLISGIPDKWRWGMMGFAIGILFAWLVRLAVQKWKNRPTVVLINCADKIAELRKTAYQIFYENHVTDALWKQILFVWEPIHQKAQSFNNDPSIRDALELKAMYLALYKAAAPVMS